MRNGTEQGGWDNVKKITEYNQAGLRTDAPSEAASVQELLIILCFLFQEFCDGQ